MAYTLAQFQEAMAAMAQPPARWIHGMYNEIPYRPVRHEGDAIRYAGLGATQEGTEGRELTLQMLDDARAALRRGSMRVDEYGVYHPNLPPQMPQGLGWAPIELEPLPDDEIWAELEINNWPCGMISSPSHSHIHLSS